jgi:hypothetical protein
MAVAAVLGDILVLVVQALPAQDQMDLVVAAVAAVMLQAQLAAVVVV